MIIGEKKLVKSIVFITACGAGVSAISSPVGMGPTPVEDRGQHQEGMGPTPVEDRGQHQEGWLY